MATGIDAGLTANVPEAWNKTRGQFMAAITD